MSGLKLVLPGAKYREEYLEMIEECEVDVKSRGFEFLIPASNNQSFENDIKKLLEMHNGIGLQEGWVPASVFWLIDADKNRIYGAIMIRPKLNEVFVV